MNGVGRFLSRRERKDKPLHVPAKDAYRVFCEEKDKKATREEEKHIHDINKRLDQLEISNIKEYNIKYALHHPYAHGDPERALELLRLLHETLSGKLVKFNPVIPMVGAENRNMVSCYIDSLLFSMFARVDSFESMLSVKFADAATNNLANLIRLWVNMLRTGKLITVDLVKHIQDALAECGWQEAGLTRQQDVSEAFTLITDVLALPLLTLKMDVYHTGKESSDDHRLVRERLLDVAIPEEPLPEGATLRLEDCLENFLNNKVEVRRMLQRRNTINSKPVELLEKEALSAVTSLDAHVEAPLFRKFTIKVPRKQASNVHMHKDDIGVSYGPKTAESNTVLRKEVLLPAWQFFHLIPWFQNKMTTEGQVTSDVQVAAHFATRRPILGICLKRYKQTADGPKRLDTYIDIPLEMRLPHFISDGTEDDGFGSSFSTFKLSLQSTVCHRGQSLNAGHYISIVRPSAHEISSGDSAHDSKYQWLRHDDLAKDDRVTVVDVRKALKDELPYLLFYQVQPIHADEEYRYMMRSSSEYEQPPTYAEAVNSSTNSPLLSAVPENASKQTADVPAISKVLGQSTPARNSVDEARSRQASAQPSPAMKPVPSPRLPSIAALERRQSAPTRDDLIPRPTSIDISSANRSLAILGNDKAGRKSYESASQRSSIQLTDVSNVASTLPTPLHEESSLENGLGINQEAGIKGGTSPGKLFSLRRGRQSGGKDEDADKERDTDKSEKRLSRSWLTTVNKHTRPKSVPPTDGRTSMADLMKTFKLGGSKDKLPTTNVFGPEGEVISQETSSESSGKPHSNRESPKMTSNGFDATKPRKELKDKYVGLGIGRRRSLRSKGGARRLSLVAFGQEDKEDPDRQCSIM